MSNMSYCRWHNTYQALRDCANTLPELNTDDEPYLLSAEERRARLDTLQLAAQMLESLGVTLLPSDYRALSARLAAL